MNALISLNDVTFTAPVRVARQRQLKTDLLGLARQFYFAKPHWQERIILDGIDMSINDGDRIAVVGHNGAGKSSLLHMLGGNYHPSKGSVVRSGKVQAIYNLTVGFNPKASGVENIYLRGLLMGMSLAELSDKRDEIIQYSELQDHIHKPLGIYSTGMKLRLAFAITMCVTPDVLVMDEWLNVGDRDFKSKAHKRLIQFVNESNALVLATHSEKMVKSLCNRFVLLRDGKIIDDDKVSDKFTMPI